MQYTNPDMATVARRNNIDLENRSTEGGGSVAPRRRRHIRALSCAAPAAAVCLMLLSTETPSLQTVAQAQTRDEVVPPVRSVASGQLPQIELRSFMQSAIDGLRKQDSDSKQAAVPAKRSAETANPVGIFQGGTCIDPHPGSPSQSQQPIDQCHTQVWYKFTDGCTGYRIVATPGGGGRCGNQETLSEGITWTFCAAKHSR